MVVSDVHHRVPSTNGAAIARESRCDADLAEIVSAAAEGSADAWRALFGRFTNMISAIARGCRLNDADVAEVHQATWMRMVENIVRIEQPERIGAWLATTAKRESLRVVRQKDRLTLDHEGLLQRADTKMAPVDAGPLAEERLVAVRAAFERLPSHCRRLLSLMSEDDPPSYKEISHALSMPIGSIGPTRGRCLEHLRRILAELAPEL